MSSNGVMNWLSSLSDEWQIAIFTIAAPLVLAGLGYAFKKLFKQFKSEPPAFVNDELAESLFSISENIRKMLSSYVVELESTTWKPHISTSNREFCLAETSRIEAQIDEKFKKHFEHESLSLLKRATIILNKTDYTEQTQVLTGAFLLNEYCNYLNEIAEELKLSKKT